MPRGGGSRICPARDHASHTPNDGGKGAGMPNQNVAGDTGVANTTPNDGGVLRTWVVDSAYCRMRLGSKVIKVIHVSSLYYGRDMESL